MFKRICIIMIIGVFVLSGMNLVALEKQSTDVAKVSKKAIGLQQKGDKAADAKEYAKALEYYQKVIQIEPAYAVPHYKMGLVYQAQKNYKDAIPCFDKALELQPAYPEAAKAAIDSLYQQAQASMEIEGIMFINDLYLKLIEYPAKEENEKNLQTDVLFQIGSNFEKLHQFEKSNEYLAKFKSVPGVEKAYKDNFISSIYMIGRNYFHLQELQLAIDYMNDFLEATKENTAYRQLITQAHLMIALCSYQLLEEEIIQKPESDIEGRAALAKANTLIVPHLLKTIELRSDIEQAYVKLGNYYYYCRDFDNAIKYYQVLADNFPHSTDIGVYVNFLENFKKEKEKEAAKDKGKGKAKVKSTK